jgi:hypothetical protein
MNENDRLLDRMFSEKLDNYYKHIKGNCVWIELTKCCGFSTFISVYKMSKLANIYNNARCHLSNIPIQNLYVMDGVGNKLVIPCCGEGEGNADICINDFLNSNRAFFKPIYPLPNDVVYKVYIECSLEGGCCVCNQNNMEIG